MKFGQALSVYEAAIPDEYAAPYREALTKLQNAAPPMPTATVHRVMAEQLGRSWMSHFAEFSDEAAAAASIGQVHKAVWHDGREVAVKIQYPGAADALKADMAQLNRLGPLLGLLVPGVQIRPLLAELRARVMEELDYAAEADNQRAFAKAYAGDPDILVPKVVASAPKVVVSEWMDGVGMSRIIAAGTTGRTGRVRPAADRAALLRTGPGRVVARGPTSGQLQVDRRRAAGGHRLRVDRPAARRHSPDHRPDLPDGARGPGGGRGRRAARGGFHPGRLPPRPGVADGLRRAVRGAATPRDVPLHPRLDAAAGRPDGGPDHATSRRWPATSTCRRIT